MADAQVIDRRSVLAPLVGKRVLVRAVVMKGSVATINHRLVPTTLLGFVDVVYPTAARVGTHVWLKGADWCGAGLARAGERVEAAARVDCYPGRDPATQRYITRFGLAEAGEPRRMGPVLLAELIDQLAELYGWEQLADTVAACHPG